MITYEQLQTMSKELSDLDQAKWTAALFQDKNKFNELEKILSERLNAYETAYAEYYGNIESQSKCSDPDF